MPEVDNYRRELVLASNNAGKLSELSAMLQPMGWKVCPQGDWVTEEAVEDGLSFVENALIKARHAARFSELPSLGDDSGLVVNALHGKPGIYSSRFAGDFANDQDNNDKLLRSLKGVDLPHRTAHFYCAIALVRHAQDPVPLIATGKWSGRILETPAGRGGFGYDPLFWVAERNCSSAELPPGLKNKLSHRGQALTALAGQMKNEFGV
jgi:XTP/dITP diphosphohydrolase